ncbi:MAG: GNAT family N-acetyltransferase, partial [Acidimicrobiales bacterium]
MRDKPLNMERDWPPFSIRIEVDDVAMRPVRDADLPTLVELLPDDVELDPSSEMFAGLDVAGNRRRTFLQGCWRSAGTWSPDAWWLPFLVTHRGSVVGVQTLEADHFRELRVVDSSSWLVPAIRGRGVGVAIRTGVLSLAFDHLGAEAAVSSAREDNVASLGVSRRLGYKDNGISRTRSPTGPCAL